MAQNGTRLSKSPQRPVPTITSWTKLLHSADGLCSKLIVFRIRRDGLLFNVIDAWCSIPGKADGQCLPDAEFLCEDVDQMIITFPLISSRIKQETNFKNALCNQVLYNDNESPWTLNFEAGSSLFGIQVQCLRTSRQELFLIDYFICTWLYPKYLIIGYQIWFCNVFVWYIFFLFHLAKVSYLSRRYCSHCIQMEEYLYCLL